MNIKEAVELVKSRNGNPREDDWDLIEAADVLVDMIDSPPILRDISTAPKDGTWIMLFHESPDPLRPLYTEPCRYRNGKWYDVNSEEFAFGVFPPQWWLPMPVKNE